MFTLFVFVFIRLFASFACWFGFGVANLRFGYLLVVYFWLCFGFVGLLIVGCLSVLCFLGT